MGAVQALPRAAEALGRGSTTTARSGPRRSRTWTRPGAPGPARAATANPAGVAATVRQNLRNVKSAGVVDAVAAVAQRKLAYLAKHAPTPPIAAPLSRAQWRPAPAEIDRFAWRVRAANDPIGVLDDVSRGVVTAEAVDTLREVYPRFYEEARSHLLPGAGRPRGAATPARGADVGAVRRAADLTDGAWRRSPRSRRSARRRHLRGGPTSPAMTPAPGGAPNVSDLFMTGADRQARQAHATPDRCTPPLASSRPERRGQFTLSDATVYYAEFMDDIPDRVGLSVHWEYNAALVAAITVEGEQPSGATDRSR